jgi:hypothetical protein
MRWPRPSLSKQNLTSTQCVAQVPHFLTTEEAYLKTQPQSLLRKTLKHKTRVLEVLLQCAIVDIYVVKVVGNELG